MNEVMKKPGWHFSFSGLMLLLLDAIFVLGSVIILIAMIMSDANGGMGITLQYNGTYAPHYQVIVFENILWLLFLGFFWSIHLVLASARGNNPFRPQNVALLNSSGIVIILGSLMSYNPSWDNSGIYFNKLPHGIQAWLSSGIFWGVVILAMAAVFNKGVELRQEELRLREEQALTV